MQSDSLERLLGQHYDLDLTIPRSISTSVKSTPRSSIITAPLRKLDSVNLNEYGQNLTKAEASGIRLLCDDSTSHEYRERIAVSILNGNYDEEISRVKNGGGTVSAFEREAELLSQIVQGPIRAELHEHNFLELSCNSIAVDTRSPRKVAYDKCCRAGEDDHTERKEVRKLRISRLNKLSFLVPCDSPQD